MKHTPGWRGKKNISIIIITWSQNKLSRNKYYDFCCMTVKWSSYSMVNIFKIIHTSMRLAVLDNFEQVHTGAAQWRQGIYPLLLQRRESGKRRVMKGKKKWRGDRRKGNDAHFEVLFFEQTAASKCDRFRGLYLLTTTKKALPCSQPKTFSA